MANHPQSDSHIPRHFSRRDFLLRGGAGFGALALCDLLARDNAHADDGVRPADGAHHADGAKPPHFAPRARNVIFLFMEGGPSHIDLFDYKPELNRLAGNPLPESFKPVLTAMGETDSPLLECRRAWRQHGEGGLWISDWLPHVATCADDLVVLRSCVGDGLNHSGGVCQMNSGSIFGGRPSLGSWVTYGLGTENENLPAFVVMQDTTTQVVNGPRNWSAGFMPATYQGVRFKGDGDPIPNLNPAAGTTAERQRAKLDLLSSLNRRHYETRADQTELEARIKSYELAYRMQSVAPEVIDLGDETEETRDLYGFDDKRTVGFGRICLQARRLVERGVRFVQLYHGSGSKWDSHKDLEKNHSELCGAMDKPVAGLLKDLKRRGLLNETLVIWGGEFGRTPMSEKGNGRDHNPYGFTMWLAGAGLRGGRALGATDDVGLHAVEDRLHIHDLHATFLHLLGLDHMRLVYSHRGRPERPTLNEGAAFRKLLG